VLSYIITSPPTHASTGQLIFSVTDVVAVDGASLLIVKKAHVPTVCDILAINESYQPLLTNGDKLQKYHVQSKNHPT
jgi:hypothetical protein